jgi:hypothetical protein
VTPEQMVAINFSIVGLLCCLLSRVEDQAHSGSLLAWVYGSGGFIFGMASLGLALHSFRTYLKTRRG